jgi:hypothetical protein
MIACCCFRHARFLATNAERGIQVPDIGDPGMMYVICFAADVSD